LTSTLLRSFQRSAIYIFLAFTTIVFAFPFYWLLISAFKDQAQIFKMPPDFLPLHPRFQNFIDLAHSVNIGQAFLNSVICSAGNVFICLFASSLAGFAFAKYPSAPGHARLFNIVLATMLIPGAVLLIPQFLVMVRLHWIDTYWAIIIPGAVNAFGIYWMRQYIQAHVPEDLLNAARIDGCSEFSIYYKIVLPVIRPALAALGIMQLIGSWNNLMWAFIVLRSPQMYTLPVLIYLLNGEERTPYGMLMAGGLLSVLPLVVAFLLMQKQFIAGITAGAVKQ
jgi:ABC-type glycerol-3-phosphate transport system permease component